MNILLVNDDGIESEGIKLLAEKLSQKHNVYTIAPDRNRSAVSNGATMFAPMEIKKVGKRCWTCSGLPADCVSTGLISNLLEKYTEEDEKLNGKIDVVLSGINYGPNLGSDIIFSGTCAGAREAVLYGVPGIALSIDPISWEDASKNGFKFKPLCEFVSNNLESLIKLCSTDILPENKVRTFVNVNAPNLSEYKGVKVTNSACRRNIKDKLVITEKDGFLESNLEFGNSGSYCAEDGDYSVVRDGYISVSTVIVDPVLQEISSDLVDGIHFSV